MFNSIEQWEKSFSDDDSTTQCYQCESEFDNPPCADDFRNLLCADCVEDLEDAE